MAQLTVGAWPAYPGRLGVFGRSQRTGSERLLNLRVKTLAANSVPLR